MSDTNLQCVELNTLSGSVGAAYLVLQYLQAHSCRVIQGSAKY